MVRSKIVSFYLGEYPHHGSGLTIDEMWKWDDQRIDAIQGFFPWWFPTRRETYSLDWDPITTEEIEQFKSDPRLRKRVLASFYRMLRFLGLEVDAGGGQLSVRRAANYEQRRAAWVRKDSHTYRRISRMLQSLVLLGFRDAAEILLAALMEIYYQNQSEIGPETCEFWTLSVTDPAYWNGDR